MFNFAGRGAVGSADIHFAKADLGFIVLIQCPSVRFRWARGANARGRTIERGKSSLALGSPLSLMFSPAPLRRCCAHLFTYPVLSGGVSHLFDKSQLFERKTFTK